MKFSSNASELFAELDIVFQLYKEANACGCHWQLKNRLTIAGFFGALIDSPESILSQTIWPISKRSDDFMGQNLNPK
jgi:hypothetical protein